MTTALRAFQLELGLAAGNADQAIDQLASIAIVLVPGEERDAVQLAQLELARALNRLRALQQRAKGHRGGQNSPVPP